ncbi:unnamed protein product [Cunninghamella echinulata]
MSSSIMSNFTSQLLNNNNNNTNEEEDETEEAHNHNITPPDYSIYAIDSPPPDYITLEDTTCLQQKSIDNVTTQSCHDHISFLYSIHVILETIPQSLRYLYLCRAETRYIQWLRLLQREKPSFQSIQNMMIPPMDVMFCWYVHMLSPYRYYDDLIKNNWEFVYNYPLPLEKARDVKTKSYSGKDPLSERFWCAFIPSEPYELTLEVLQEDNERLYTCYFCHETQNSSWEEYCEMRINSKKSILCKHCGSINSCETISAYQFIKDFLNSTRKQVSLKGIMVDCNGNKAKLNTTESAAMYLMSQLVQEHQQQPIFDESMLNSSEVCQWSIVYKHLKRVNKRLERFRKGTWDVLLTITKTCYFHIISPLCIDLIQAAGRQYDFITKLVATDWPKISTLRFAIRRYGLFLHLIKQEPSLMAIPTLDIDVCWHTHMISSPKQYARYCMHVFGHLLNHNDALLEKSFLHGLESTATTWHNYFGSKIDEPYTTCPSTLSLLPPTSSSSTLPLLGKWVKQKQSVLNKKGIATKITTMDIYLNDDLNFINNKSQLTNQYETTNNNDNNIDNNDNENNNGSNPTTALLLSRYESPPPLPIPLVDMTHSVSTTTSSSFISSPSLSTKQKHDLFLASMTTIALHHQKSVNTCFGCYMNEQESSHVSYYGFIGNITGDSLIL